MFDESCQADKLIVLTSSQDVRSFFLNKGLTESQIHIVDEMQLSFCNVSCSPENSILLAYRNSSLKAVTKKAYDELLQNRCRSVYIWPIDLKQFGPGSTSSPIKIDVSKPRFSRLEIEINERCNLNCRGCTHYSNLVEGKGTVDLDQFKEDLIQLKSLYWGIETLRLMGGEPLMAHNFIDFVSIARSLFPDSDIALVTNGLLIPNLSEESLDQLSNFSCKFTISNYPPTQDKRTIIEELLSKHGIEYDFGPPIRFFYKGLSNPPSFSPAKSYKNCLFKQCHSMRNGKICICGLSNFSYRLNSHFGDQLLPTDENIDIYDVNIDGWAIEKFLNSPKKMCSYCSNAMIPFKWSQCQRSEARLSDYFIKNNILYKKVIPKVQYVTLPVIRRLYNSYTRRHNKK